MTQFIIGIEEWAKLEELGVPAIKIKVDSGANISSIHAFNIRTYFDKNHQEMVSFSIYPIQDNRKIQVNCTLPLKDRRMIRSSNGQVEKRPVINSKICIGEFCWPIDISLTNRDNMEYRMLLGREAMQGVHNLLLDPHSKFLSGSLYEKDLTKVYQKSRQPSTTLQIAILGANPKLYSTQRIMEEGQKRGHKMRFLNVKHCYLKLSSQGSAIYCSPNEELIGIDAVIPRLGPSMTFYGCSLMRQFKAAGVFCLNEAEAIVNSRNKLQCLQLLASKSIDIPNTSYAISADDTKELLKQVNGTPVIVKLLEGSQGIGVMLLDSNKTAESVISALKSLEANILVQEFIQESKGCDIRAFVIGNEVVASMQRQAANGDFRSNIHLGGIATPIKLTPNEKKTAVSAAKIIGLRVAGVDMMRSSGGIKVIELNSSPGLEGIEKASKKNVAELMLEYIEQKILGSNK